MLAYANTFNKPKYCIIRLINIINKLQLIITNTIIVNYYC